MEMSFRNDMIESLKQAVDHAKGQSTTGKVRVVEVLDIRSLRKRLTMSQQTFSSAYRRSCVVLKDCKGRLPIVVFWYIL